MVSKEETPGFTDLHDLLNLMFIEAFRANEYASRNQTTNFIIMVSLNVHNDSFKSDLNHVCVCVCDLWLKVKSRTSSCEYQAPR